MSPHHNSAHLEIDSGQTIPSSSLLRAAAHVLNHSDSWYNSPIAAATLGVVGFIAVWTHALGVHVTPATWGILIGLATTSSVSAKGLGTCRSTVIRFLLRDFLQLQRASRGGFYDMVLGVNVGGMAVSAMLIDEHNRAGGAPVKWETVDCTQTALDADGNLRVHPDSEKIATLRRKMDRYTAKLSVGEKLRVLVVHDESRTGETVNRLRARLAHPAVDLEVLVLIRRPNCKGTIDWCFLNSANRHLSPCAETPKQPRCPCRLRGKKPK